jgi:peptide/nickel transport system substrate-binding protein
MQWRWPATVTGTALAVSLVASMSLFGGSAVEAASGPTSITLSEGVQVEPNWWFANMPAQYCTTENSMFTDMAYRPLIWIANNDTIDYSQSIATGITVNSQDTVFTVHLGTRYKWSNGQTVNAYDALYDAQLLLQTSQNGSVWTQCGAGIGGFPTDWKSVTAPNATTLVITTTTPVNPLWFEENGIGQIYPIPKSVWDKYSNWKQEESWILKVGVNPAAPQLQVIDGPYGYGPYSNNAYSTLIANPHYTGPDPAHIKTIHFLYDTSPSNLWAAALRGTFASVTIPTEYNNQRFQLERLGYKLALAQYGFCFNYAQPNLNPQDPAAPLLSLRYVRQALELGLDQQDMIKLAGGLGVPIYGPVPPIPRTVYYDPQVAKYAYSFNPARGKRILEAHGWRMKNGVMTNSKGQTLTFTLLYMSGSNWVTNSVQLWKSNLAKEGIVLNLQSELFNQLIQQVDTTHKWEIAWWGGGWCYEPDYYPTGYGLFAPGASANTGDFNDPHLTQLILATHAPGTPAQEIQRMFAYEIYAAEVLPYLYMPNLGAWTATVKWLHIPHDAWNPVQAINQFNLWYTTAP